MFKVLRDMLSKLKPTERHHQHLPNINDSVGLIFWELDSQYLNVILINSNLNIIDS